ncbi:mechanosensitive ion channel family protein [Urechidicola vernalis]|uniref:Mechanosensitive ion channel n=1 Tax=Urechidicola vernalis TaxID=3075600 RepID=A0ABU2Y2V1_9FLAO|nr:mechanosensitive ion channel domain-containing protein [Urechidicola sp. P050]MDT0552485.1 mechanosensitive ion channel [Urechidicola sp. P050]
MNSFSHFFYDKFTASGIGDETAMFLNLLVLVVSLFIILYVIDFLLRKIIINAFNRFAEKSNTNFDNLMVKNKAPRNIAHIVPVIIADSLIPIAFIDFENAGNFVSKGLEVFGVLLTLWIVRSLLNTFKDYFKTLPRLKDKPIDSYIQVFMIFAWAFGFIVVLVIIADIHIPTFLATMGAASAVILLMFKDTIMGFVASIQVATNDMVRIGDWITFEKYGADGDVIEINLTTVKVQNFDKTITTIPTYSLISDSVKNWRGMEEAGGRRIKRALIIKQESVKHLSTNDIDELKKIQLISAYIEKRQADIEQHNIQNGADKSLLINGRNLTNMGVFRKYMETYVENHSAINDEMTVMVRQLAPTSQGIPIEIYAFSADKVWKNYEYIMADIFDHLVASVGYFNLELFELPSNTTFKTN